jgi:uncharacterized protein YndB with AHSA1/START domain
MSQEATITRVFDAPRETVWRYFTDPELFGEWFGHDPYKTTATMDVREGGRWTATMVSEEDGSELPFAGKFVEIVEPERLVQTFEDVANAENTQTETLTTTLEDAGDGKTRVTYHQVGHMPAEEYSRVEEGVNGFYDRLADHLARA